MSLSSGWPGSILFSMPSSPAIIIAAKAMYGLQLGSGGRNSTRLALGDAEYIGMRQAAERLRRVSKIHRSFKPRHQALVGVGGRRDDRGQSLAVLDQSADVPQCSLGETGIAIAGKERFAVLP